LLSQIILEMSECMHHEMLGNVQWRIHESNLQ